MVNYDRNLFRQKAKKANTMKATKLLHKSLSTACPDMHKMRLKALISGVTSGYTEHQVTVTGQRWHLKSHSKKTTKHDVK